MKKTLLFISILSLSQSAFTQYYYSGNYGGFSSYSLANNIEYGNSIEEKNILQYRIENKIRERKTIDIDKKGKIDKNPSIETYNKIGRTISIKSNKYQFLTDYINDSIVTHTKSIYKKDTTEMFYVYDSKNKLKGYKSYRNGKLFGELIITKNSFGKITSRLNRYGKNLKKSSEMKYYFDENNQMLKSEHYVNGKLKNVWNYDCKPEGEIIPNKKVEQKSVCKWNENLSNGDYIIIYRTTEKEKSYLHKSYYSKDSIFYKSEQFLNDTIKVHSFEKNNFQSVSKTFGKSGQLRYENIQLFYDNKLIKSNYNIRYTRRKSSISEQNYTYSKLNLISTSTYYHNKKRLNQIKYEYSFFE